MSTCPGSWSQSKVRVGRWRSSTSSSSEPAPPVSRPQSSPPSPERPVGVFEKADLVGGTTAWSGGQVWIPNNPHMGEVGVADSRDKALTYIMSLSRDMLEQPSGRGLRRRRARRWSSCSRPRRRCSSTPCAGMPDYHPEFPGGSPDGGRTLECPIYPFDELGEWAAPGHAVAVLRRPAHHDERDAARQGGPRAAVAGGARSAGRCTTSAAVGRRWPAGCCAAASTAASSRARRRPAAS